MSSSNSLLHMSITEIAPMIQAKKVSPVEIIQSSIVQAEKLSYLNTFITPMFDYAMDQAKKREKAIGNGEYLGPLDGIPIGIKDNIEVAGVRSTAGTKALNENIASVDAHVVTKLKQAGAIILGKENLHELAAGGRSNNPHYGFVKNPWDIEKIPGGSSGGSGANVAACITFASLGTDIGGSVRFPAHCCGVVGMKQTFGRASQRGLMLTSYDGDHISPITRTVADSAVVLQSYVGHDIHDPTTVKLPLPDFSKDIGTDLEGIKIGVPLNHYFDVIDDEVEVKVRQSISALEELGATVVDIKLPYTEYAGALWVLMASEMSVTAQKLLKNHGHGVSPDLLVGLLATQFILARDYIKAHKLQRLIKEGFAEAFSKVDAIATPTAPLPAINIDADVVSIKGVEYSLRLTRDEIMGRATHLSNRTGLPSISVPCGFSDGMPVGLQLIGRPFDESTLYKIADAYESSASSSRILAELAK